MKFNFPCSGLFEGLLIDVQTPETLRLLNALKSEVWVFEGLCSLATLAFRELEGKELGP